MPKSRRSDVLVWLVVKLDIAQVEGFVTYSVGPILSACRPATFQKPSLVACARDHSKIEGF